MDKETKITYSTIAILIFILGGIAYFLQSNITMPDVEVKEEPKIAVKKPVEKTETKETNKNTQTNSSTTMTLPEKITSAVITTNKGTFEVTFSNATPETVKNFAKLAMSNFYSGTRFHRVIKDFMIQGGDPLSKDLAESSRWGQGGPGYTFKDEFNKDDALPQGTLAMANAGPGTNGSQFFIVTAVAGTPWLVGKHTVFGHVTQGMDVVLKIGNSPTKAGDQPVDEVIVEKVEIK